MIEEKLDPVVIPENLDDTPDNNKLLLNNSKQFNQILIKDNLRLKSILNMVIKYFIIKDKCVINEDCIMASYLKDSENVPPQCDMCIVQKLMEMRGH